MNTNHKTRKNKRRHGGSSKTSRLTVRNKLLGGDVIGSGGFGCVFRPSLVCTKKKQRKPNMVTKLLTKKHAKKEYSMIRSIRTKLKGIPNYSKYFLIDNISSCQPVALSNSDLVNFDRKCKPMKKYENITAENINEHLDKLRSINLPDGGISLSAYNKKLDSISDFQNINNLLIELLTEGIIPMNSQGVYHADIKEANILYNKKRNTLGLIDWGLSFYINSNRSRIPKIVKNKPFQYNIPFSIIIFNKMFDSMYTTFLKNTKSIYQDNEMEEFVEEYIDVWNKKRGNGHFDLIEEIWQSIINDQDVDVIKTFIVPYITNILVSYTVNKSFRKIDYFHEVFLPNLDIWGLLMSYSTLIDNANLSIKPSLSNIYLKYLFLTSSTPIDVLELEDALKQL